MTWMSWRQFRSSASVAAVGLIAIAILLGITGVHLSHLYADYRSEVANGCGGPCTANFGYHNVKLVGSLLIAIPAIIGIFWGAPLVAREMETGTFRLAFTQSVSRNRWLANKLAVVMLGAVAAVGLYSFAMTWWAIPFDRVSADRLSPAIFDQRGIAPIGYVVFAVALGVFLGALSRRTLPAMVGTLVGFIVVRMLTQYFLRPILLTPVRTAFSLAHAGGIGIASQPGGPAIITGTPNVHGAWVTSSKLVDAAGHAPSAAFIRSACPGLPGANPAGPGGPSHVPAPAQAQQAFHHCVQAVSKQFHIVATYQPGSRFWEFQWLELAIFVGFAAIFVAGTFALVRRRVS